MAFSATRMLMAAAGVSVTPPVTTGATFFNAMGGTDYSVISYDANSISSSYTGILSCWINIAAFPIDANGWIWVAPSPDNATLRITPTGKIYVALSNSSGGEFGVQSNSSLSTGVWYNILCSWNTDFASGSKILNLYVNNTAYPYTVEYDSPAFLSDYTGNPFYIGAYASSITAQQWCLTEFYFAPGQFLDFTVSGNRALFYAGGVPANLGSNGQTPTGSSPAVYWHGVYNNLTNLGTLGGSFTASGNALTACGSYPAYTASAAQMPSTSTVIYENASSLSSSQTGIFSCWVNLSGVPSGQQAYLLSDPINSNYFITVYPYGGGSTTSQVSLQLGNTSTSYVWKVNNGYGVTTGTWCNILCSWNTAASPVINIYINGVAMPYTLVSTVGSLPFSTTYATTKLQIGNGGGQTFPGCISEWYFAPGQFLDFTNPSNVALFYDGGNPVYLGASGQIPTGTSPAFYWKGLYSNLTNLGSVGGSLTVTGGSLIACGSAP